MVVFHIKEEEILLFLYRGVQNFFIYFFVLFFSKYVTIELGILDRVKIELFKLQPT